MPRPALPVLAALIATPAFALPEGAYPVAGGAGEIVVTDRLLSISISGPDGCEAAGEGRVLRGADGAWGAILGTGGALCVLVGDGAGFEPVGAGCAALSTGSCELRGQLENVSAARPVQVITALLRGRFSRMAEADRRAIQSLLAERGFYAGGVDGAYGPGTEAALIAQIQALSDRGEPVDGNSATFVRGLLEGMAREGAALRTQAAPAAAVPIYVGSWSCGGYTFRFGPDEYQVINEYDGSVLNRGRLRPDGVVGRTAYLELVGYGNLTFDGVGTRDMIMHDPVSAETWDCAAR